MIMREIIDFESYEISISGEVINTRTGRKLKVGSNQKGYKQVQISNGVKSKTISIHRVVWESYKGVIPKGMEINHIDGNKENNHVANLEVLTRKENMRHAVEIGLIKSGVDCLLSVSVNQIDVITGDVINTYGSIRQAEKITGVHGSSISRVCSGSSITAGGFKWIKVTK